MSQRVTSVPRELKIVSDKYSSDTWRRTHYELTFLTRWEYDTAYEHMWQRWQNNTDDHEWAVFHDIEIRLGDEMEDGDDEVCDPDLYVLSYSVFRLVQLVD